MGLPSSSRPMQTCADPCSCHTLRRLLQLCVGLCAITAAVLLLHVPGRIPWSHFLCWAGESASAGDALSPQQLSRLSSGRHMCQQWNTSPVLYASPVPQSRKNPRWQPELADTDGDIEEGTLLLRNATLFDGQTWLPYPVDIELHCGVIRAISPTTIAIPAAAAVVQDLQGRHVTPGLVDMHAHQMIGTFPLLDATAEFNEFGLGPLTPFLHAMHGLKPYDPAVRIILAGGITSSLILPGSSNIMGGEGVLVKNALDRGVGREPVVDALRLEHGIEPAQRRRYMKMACGENPKGIHGHVRTGTSWLLRDHLHHAASLRDAQDAWCDAVHAADSAHDVARLATLAAEGAPDNLALASTVALLRGQIDAHVHCYEPEDMEMMLAHTAEAGFAVRAFHHALDAWKVPNMLKTAAKNITIATFVEFGGFKKEAYDSNLWAGRILAEHGIDLAYKSDHGLDELNARYVLFQAATAHAFHLPEDLALQAVTSVPARSLRVDHRVGYARAGYDADLVVWNGHPLSLGATPLQVYVDGHAEFDDAHTAAVNTAPVQTTAPPFRPTLTPEARNAFCANATNADAALIVTGIRTSYLNDTLAGPNLTLVLHRGRIVCLGAGDDCAAAAAATAATGNAIPVNLTNGHVLPGLTAVSVALGMAEMNFVDSTGDGSVSTQSEPLNPADVVHAQYGVHLDGKFFARARIGGVTRAITPPFGGGFIKGVSVAISTMDNEPLLGRGIVRSDAALHVQVGEAAKVTESITTISSAIAKLRQILAENHNRGNVYGRAANGSLPLLVHAENKDVIRQMIALKTDFPAVQLVIVDGTEAPLVATELAAANISLIFTGARGAPDSWEKKDVLVGPPLAASGVSRLAAAGVKFGLAISGLSDAHIHNLLLEASWAAKLAGLSTSDAVALVSRNIEEILHLDVDKDSRDFVIYEGDPLEFGASPILMVDGRQKRVLGCWPTAI